MKQASMSATRTTYKTIVYIVCTFLAILSIFPFWIMFMNATRSTFEIQQSSIGLIPSKYFMNNWKILTGKAFSPMTGFVNSMTVSVG
ncbi:MAG: carbohydrate ABC transporter permease, partial [Sphaerochaeta sp.]